MQSTKSASTRVDHSQPGWNTLNLDESPSTLSVPNADFIKPRCRTMQVVIKEAPEVSHPQPEWINLNESYPNADV